MTLDDLLPYVMPDIEGCPEPLAIRHLRQAAIEFCRRSLAWRYMLAFQSAAPLTEGELLTLTSGAGLNTTAGDPLTMASIAGLVPSERYGMTLPAEAAVVKLLRFYVDGEKGVLMTPEYGEDMRQARAANDGAWTTDLTNIEVSPRPASVGIQYQAAVALRPTETATTITNAIGNEYAQVIADGALGRLLRINGAAWINVKLADDATERFERETNRAAARVARGYGRSSRRVRSFHY